MTIKASGRWALILATAFLVCFAGPSRAQEGANSTAASSKSESAGAPIVLNKYTKQNARQSKKHEDRKSSKAAPKSSTAKKAAADDAVVDDAAADNASAMPAWVANANAQLEAVDTPASNAKAMSERASNILQTAPAEPQPAAGTQVVSADQLNDVDRALQVSTPPAPTPAIASADTPVVSSSNESSTWDQTSLIGKIFIAFGGLLTLASAARMFMA